MSERNDALLSAAAAMAEALRPLAVEAEWIPPHTPDTEVEARWGSGEGGDGITAGTVRRAAEALMAWEEANAPD